MLTYLFMAVAQLTDPKMRGVLWLGVFGALAVFSVLWAAVWWLLIHIDPSSIWGLSSIVHWLGQTFDWLAGFAFFGTMIVATFLMFPAVVTIVVGLFLDRVAAIVEERHYPELGPARNQPVIETVLSAIKFAAVVILLNLVVLPAYVILIFIPGANLVLYYLLNGYLVGREFFELAAFRRMTEAEAHRLRRAYRGKVLLAGVILTFLMTVPVVNLLAPVLGAAFMVHVTQDLLRRQAVKIPA
jgi:CysZ protein